MVLEFAVRPNFKTHHHDFINQSFATLCDLCASAVEKTNCEFFEDGNHELHEMHETEAGG